MLFAGGSTVWAVVDIVPEPAGQVAGAPGALVDFRKGTISQFSITGADQLFALPASDPSVLGIATDNGVSVLNYMDTGGGNDFS